MNSYSSLLNLKLEMDLFFGSRQLSMAKRKHWPNRIVSSFEFNRKMMERVSFRWVLMISLFSSLKL